MCEVTPSAIYFLIAFCVKPIAGFSRFSVLGEEGAEKMPFLQSIKRALSGSLLNLINLSIEIVKVSFP